MDFVLIKDFFKSFSLPTLIIAVFVSAISILCDKFVGNKINSTIKHYGAFALSVILYFLYDVVFVLHSFSYRSESLYAGILAGSLSTIISCAITRIIQGKTIRVSATALLIERLIKDFVCEDRLCQVVNMIENIILSSNDENAWEEQVKELLTAHSTENVDKTQINDIAVLLINSVNSLKNEKR